MKLPDEWMPDIPKYIKLQRQRDKLKREMAKIFGKDLNQLLKDFERLIDEIILANADPLTLTASNFRALVDEFFNELQRRSGINLERGRSGLIELHNAIKQTLDFNYPIDYNLFPKTTSKSEPLLREIGAMLKKYREGKLEEKSLIRRIKRRFRVPVHHADSFINTQLAGFDNTSSKTIADLAGLKYGLYFGHIGPNTRKFCEELLITRRLYTEQEIRAMNNGQGLPVIRYCGGYRCMHEWMWVDRDWPQVKTLLKAA